MTATSVPPSESADVAGAATRNPNLSVADVLRAPEEGDDELFGERGEWWWTGRPPSRCAGMGEDGALTSLALPDLSRVTRAQTQAYFDNTWTLTEVLLSSLQGEAAFVRPPYHGLRHPMIFYYGHIAVFYVNKLRVAGLITDPIDPYFEQLFETGVDEMSWDDMSKNEMSWPSVREVHAYRGRVHALVSDLITNHPGLADGHPPIGLDSALWALFMAFEHERIHLETSSVLLRELPLECLREPRYWPSLHPSAREERSHPPRPGRDYPALDFAELPRGEVRLGKPWDWPSFGWDNEYGARRQDVRPFAISRDLVSNGAFWQFVADGGYRQPSHWTDEGWRWRCFRNVKWPTFWCAEGPQGLHRFKLRTLFDLIDMPWDWPAIVNCHEARAFASWLAERDGRPGAYRLPTEAEHVRARSPRRPSTAELACDAVMASDGRTLRGRGTANLNLAWSGECPVGACGAEEGAVRDLMGNVWDWCEDDFNPLPGSEVHPFYDDFSSPCYDGEHTMILGGSFISTGDEASIWARFHFRPHFFQHAGFRIAYNTDGQEGCDAVRIGSADRGNAKYDERGVLDQYLLLHYADPTEVLPAGVGPVEALDFPLRVARLALDWCEREGVGTARALDVGCAVGRTSFELARRFESVEGVDLSQAFVDAAETLRREGELGYFRRDEGDLGVDLRAQVDPQIDRARVAFSRGDACALPPRLSGCDLVVLANLLCRLPSPNAVLSRCKGSLGLVRPGGLLVITTPFTWSEAFTPKPAWLGGFEKGGERRDSFAGLRRVLEPEFVLLEEGDMPMLIREHARKFEYVVPRASVWRKTR